MDEEDPEREKPIGVQDRYLYITRPGRACKEDSSDIFRQSERAPRQRKPFPFVGLFLFYDLLEHAL